jgi:anti-sigma-K factor RskA
MGHYERMHLLFRLFPFRSWQYFLIRRHFLRCERCLANLADVEDARTATVAKDKLGEIKDFWPGFPGAAETKAKKPKWRLRPAWRWVVGSAGLLAASAALVLIMTLSPKKEAPDLTVKLRIDYAEIYGEPAQTILFQTQDANSTFVWVEKLPKGDIQ